MKPMQLAESSAKSRLLSSKPWPKRIRVTVGPRNVNPTMATAPSTGHEQQKASQQRLELAVPAAGGERGELRQER